MVSPLFFAALDLVARAGYFGIIVPIYRRARQAENIMIQRAAACFDPDQSFSVTSRR